MRFWVALLTLLPLTLHAALGCDAFHALVERTSPTTTHLHQHDSHHDHSTPTEHSSPTPDVPHDVHCQCKCIVVQAEKIELPLVVTAFDVAPVRITIKMPLSATPSLSAVTNGSSLLREAPLRTHLALLIIQV